MELQQFIKQTLQSIVSGVDEANENTQRFRLLGDKHVFLGEGTYANFDIALTVEEIKNIEGKIQGGMGDSILKIASLDLKGGGSHENRSQNIHRLTFKVFISEKSTAGLSTNPPMTLPKHDRPNFK